MKSCDQFCKWKTVQDLVTCCADPGREYFVPSLSPVYFPSLSPSYFLRLSPVHFPSLSPDYFPSLSPVYFPSLSPNSFLRLSTVHFPSLSPVHFPSLSPDGITSALADRSAGLVRERRAAAAHRSVPLAGVQTAGLRCPTSRHRAPRTQDHQRLRAEGCTARDC